MQNWGNWWVILVYLETCIELNLTGTAKKKKVGGGFQITILTESFLVTFLIQIVVTIAFHQQTWHWAFTWDVCVHNSIFGFLSVLGDIMDLKHSHVLFYQLSRLTFFWIFWLIDINHIIDFPIVNLANILGSKSLPPGWLLLNIIWVLSYAYSCV